jgi:SAM-dependent methyltransferase
MKPLELLRQSGRRAVNGAGQISTAPFRAVGTRLAYRHPGVVSRTDQWSWLWQPGWSQRWHERFYRTGEDPYDFGSNRYELQKYARLLDAVGGGRYSRVLEVGCAQGVFTEMLAPLCDELVAVDISETALARAEHRLEGCTDVRFERRTLPFDCPNGPFDLIVCADVLYYWPRTTLAFGLRRLRERLDDGGKLLLLHYLGDFGQAVPGDLVHDMAASPSLAKPPLVQRSGDTWRGVGPGGSGYRVDVLVKQR